MAFLIGQDCQIDPTAVIDVKEGFLGDHSIVRAGARIEGQKIEIGKEAFIDLGAVIGGGSCFDPQAYLKAGDWLHMGMNSQINIACGVNIGHEFGCGVETKIFTHGAYLDSYALGAPIQWASVRIGNSVWMPNAWVNPGVTIGDHVIIAARSLVNKNLPSGVLAGGIPINILQKNFLPRFMSDEQKQKLLNDILFQALKRFSFDHHSTNIETNFEAKVTSSKEIFVKYEELTTRFFVEERRIEGEEFFLSQIIKDQLRRNGIRFRFLFKDQTWQAWT